MGFGNWLKTIGEQIDAPPVLTLGLEAPSPQPVPVPKSHRGRSFEAAKTNRLTFDWGTSITGLDQELRSSLRAIRSRSRWLERNDPSMKRFLQLVEDNIAGPNGITLQVRAKRDGKPDTELNSKIEGLWKKWGRAENASANGQMSWADIQRLFVRLTARDGEVLIRKVQLDSRLGFGIQFLPVEYLDESYNADLGNGNRIIMSVEVNTYGKPIAYHLKPSDSDRLYRYVSGQRIRVPASEIIHFYLFESCDQTRGVPWIVSAFKDLKNLDGYIQAVLTTARAGACSGGVLVPETPEGYTPDDEEDAEPEPIPIEPGVFTVIPQGYGFQQFNPQQPTELFGPFITTILQRAAAAAGVAHHSLTGKMDEVTYSSARIAREDEEKMWEGKQRRIVERLCEPVYFEFLTRLLLLGEIKPGDFEGASNADHQPPTWDYIDPQKDAAAAILQIDAGVMTRTEYCAKRGKDFEDVLDRLAAEQKLASEKGVILPTAGATTLLMLQMLQQASKDKENG